MEQGSPWSYQNGKVLSEEYFYEIYTANNYPTQPYAAKTLEKDNEDN